MAEKARTVPGARGRGPKPKLEHPMQTLGRVLGFVGKKYWLHLIVVVIAIVVSVLSMVQGTLFTKTLIDSYILPLVKTVQAGGTADFSGLIHAITRVALFYACGVLASLLQARVMIYVTQGPCGTCAMRCSSTCRPSPSGILTPMPTGTSCPSTPTTLTPCAR